MVLKIFVDHDTKRISVTVGSGVEVTMAAVTRAKAREAESRAT